MNLKFLAIPLISLLCSCSQKVTVNQVFLNQDSSVGYTAIKGDKQPKSCYPSEASSFMDYRR